MNNITNLWAEDAKKGLTWFIESMGEDEWARRRENVAEYFRSIKEKKHTEEEIQNGDFEKLFNPVAVYSDWISWYMYLVESAFERLGCDDPFQSARIYPFFAVIGKGIDALKSMTGIDERLRTMFNESQNQPDSTLFELAVALMYNKNGWLVKFIEESRIGKSPDLQVSKGKIKYWVECKRFSKITGFAELERLEWQKRSKHLFNAMRITKSFAYAEIKFKVPVDRTSIHVLGAAFMYYFQTGMLKDGRILSNSEIEFKAIPLDLKRINRDLDLSPTRPNSPQMINLLIGEYDIHGNYTVLNAPRKIDTLGPDDKLWVLNEFYGGLYETYVAKWECVASSSLDQKAKDIRKMLSKAVSQIPDGDSGIIHIAYETVTGPLVEVQREQKIKEVIASFDFGTKDIESIFCHALQLLPKIDGIDWAETTSFFERQIDSILPDNMLLNLPSTDSDETHWAHDLNR